MEAIATRRGPANVLDLIGGTPLVRLAALTAASQADVWAKCEQANPGGSVKDRIALAMVESAEDEGKIKPGLTTIVEATSGNCGIALALVCAVKGYRLVLTMPESMSAERRILLGQYGAELVLTPEDRGMDGAIERAEEICRERNGSWSPQQFGNPANPEVHRKTTAREILVQLGGRPPDAFVAGVGTGGTITGIARAFRASSDPCRIVAVEPSTSAVLSGGRPGAHWIQGLGCGFVPPNYDASVVDEVRTVHDRDAWDMRTQLARREGLMVGISAGAAVHAALAVATDLGPGKRVVVLLPDSGERYLSLQAHFA